MIKAEVVVVGGGFAGVCAALAAAENGADVLLVEKGNCLGGSACSGLVFPFMTYWTKDPKTGEPLDLVQGIFRRIIEEMEPLFSATTQSRFHEEYLKLILNRMVQKAGVRLLYHAALTGVHKAGDRITGITVAAPGKTEEIESGVWIDCTGNGELSALSGCEFVLGRESDHLCQPMTLCFRVGGVKIDRFYQEKPTLTELYRQKQREGSIKNCREDILSFTYPVHGVLHLNSTRVIRRNPTDLADLTAAEIEAREQVFELFFFLKENAESFRNAEILSTAAEIGIRESRMIEGEYRLTVEDLTGCRKFEDAICCGNYDIDIHNPEGSGTSHFYFPEGTYYTVPYRSLCVKGMNNLLVAGRCISATHEAQASIRIMPICAALGQAAGTAAALCARQHCAARELSYSLLRAALEKGQAKVD